MMNSLRNKAEYIGEYDPCLLFPIDRTIDRGNLDIGDQLPFHGEDRWTAFEVSWLDIRGKPQVRVAEFILPYNSPNMIESKSFKLYLNSFNQTRFENDKKVKLALTVDLSEAAKAPVSVNMMSLHAAKSILINDPIGICVDNIDLDIIQYKPSADLLIVSNSRCVNEVIYSHLLKTNCPVTGQPDWATVFIEYTGSAIEHFSILAYIISFRGYQGYHENSVERFFCDINCYCRPIKLAVYARYTRRGGLDINPFRTNYPVGESLLDVSILRMVRQ